MKLKSIMAGSCLGILAVIGLCQEPGKRPPAFEVASVKLSVPEEDYIPAGSAAPFKPRLDPQMYLIRSSLRGLIGEALDLGPVEVDGGPEWAGTELYMVNARTASPSTPAEMRAMLLTLLADRFQLKFHWERKPMAGGILTVAKGGPKFGPQFHQVEEDGLPVATGSSRQSGQHYTRYTMKRFCSVVETNLRVTIANGMVIPHPEDAIFPIIDQTGLTGVYDISFDLKPYTDFRLLLERQLGLKVEAKKVMAQILVIDSASRPNAN